MLPTERQTLATTIQLNEFDEFFAPELLAGRQTARASGRADGTHSRWQVILPARLQECKKARAQE